MVSPNSPLLQVGSKGSIQPYPVKPFGLAAAIAVLGLVIFLSPPSARLYIVGIVIVMALLQRGGDAAAIINSLSQKVYGGGSR